MINRLIAGSRYIVLIPVIGALLAALLVTVLGGYELVRLVITLFQNAGDTAVKQVVFLLIETIDLFLLGTVFYLISIGLYELFFNQDVPVADWLVIRNIDDLKDKLLRVIVVVLGVQFLAQVLNFKSGPDILYIGLSIALVIAALALFLNGKGKEEH